jgi:hypothetical protein
MQTYTSILDNIAFRIAILDSTKKTAVIALDYGISRSHCRALRASHGRGYVYAMHYGTVRSRRWMDDKNLVNDVRTMRVKEVMKKYDYGIDSIVEMRRQLGISKPQILRSRQFKDAVKTLPPAEVARLFRLGLSVVSKYRVRFGVARMKDNALRYNPKFMTAVYGDRPAQHIADDYGCSAAYVQLLRREARPIS